MVKLLRIELKRFTDIRADRYGCIALVDTQPGTGYNCLPEKFTPDVVLDHHPIRRRSKKSAVCDIRTSYGATSTIVTEYLQAARLPPGKQVATALVTQS